MEKKYSIDSGMVNEYLHTVSGEFFTAKDFRTWFGSLIFFELLSTLESSSDPDVRNKNILQALDRVAEELGNSRTTFRKYCVHPELISDYEEGKLQKAFPAMKKKKDSKYFSATEKVLLNRFGRYKPEHVAD